ncbi:MAG TPA: mandelate racemase, partial [Oxalicibacterium sp.]|nr:mandelate racemase [Oxalicibacterium sp.]
MSSSSSVPIDRISVDAYLIPTDMPESDGTLAWDATTLVLVRVAASGCEGLGYTYADRATAALIHDKLMPLLTGCDAMAIGARWQQMAVALRNLGRPGICAMAIAAVDNALWDLKAKLLDLPLAALLGQARPAIAIYGSGGFTSYTTQQLQRQFGDWAAAGFS